MGPRLGLALQVLAPRETRCSSFPVPFTIRGSDGSDRNDGGNYNNLLLILTPVISVDPKTKQGHALHVELLKHCQDCVMPETR